MSECAVGVNLAEQDCDVGHHQPKGLDFLIIFVHKHRFHAAKGIIGVVLQNLQNPLDVIRRFLS